MKKKKRGAVDVQRLGFYPNAASEVNGQKGGRKRSRKVSLKK